MIKYIIHKRFKNKAIYGDVNLPAMTECECNGNLITYQGKAICYATSENAHQHFAINNDGMGIERGKLTQQIQKTLSKKDAHYQERWDKIWGDNICQKYKREDYIDYWLWNHEFFNASIFDLKHILGLISSIK